MPIPRVRFTMRRLMLAVGVAGLVATRIEMGRRSAEYERRACDFERREMLSRDLMASFAVPDRPEVVAVCREEYARNLALAEYEGRLKFKYRRAARYPWLLVAPDPPEPE